MNLGLINELGLTPSPPRVDNVPFFRRFFIVELPLSWIQSAFLALLNTSGPRP